MFVQFCEALFDKRQGPADGVGDALPDFGNGGLLAGELGRGRLGIFEPCDGFGGGGVLAGLCALGGVGLYERVHWREYHRLWFTPMPTTTDGISTDSLLSQQAYFQVVGPVLVTDAL